MPGTSFLIAVSITVEPTSPSTVREAPAESMKVILGIGPVRAARSWAGMPAGQPGGLI
jgi:hypothetical protein